MQSTIPCLRVSKENRERLERLKVHPRESFNDVIGRLLDQVTDNEPLTDKDRMAIAESLEELKSGEYFTHEQVKKRYGLD